MISAHICDHRDCPAFALHHIDLHGQDFHFCGHHWEKVSAALLAYLYRDDPDQTPVAQQYAATSVLPGVSPTLTESAVQYG